MLVALWVALRRPADTRLLGAIGDVDRRLEGIAAAVGPRHRPEDGLDAIGSTIDLSEVLQRTLAAAGALRAVDGSRISVLRPDGTSAVKTIGRVDAGSGPGIDRPPDGRTFVSGRATWDGEDGEALRSGLVVPVGPDGSGSLTVYSRLEDAFDAEAVSVLTAIARRATPAVLNALRYIEVQELAATDLRTGLGSALAFEEALPREISAARRHGRPLCLLQVDLDDFGRINKEHPRGLAAGDDVLTEFGERVRSTIRGSDSAFRNSGGADEFFVILTETTRQDARLLYDRLAFELGARPFADVGAVTMSAGLAELRADDTPESLQSRAGEAVIGSKRRGKNQLSTDADE